MPEGITAESLFNNIAETLADSVSKKKSVSFFEEEISNSVNSQLNRLGRQKPLHKLLGGGKFADTLLWRKKKISSGVLGGSTAIWVLFEWLDYHLLSLVCFSLVLGLLAQFVWSNASGLLNRSPGEVPRLVLPEELFVNIAKSVGAEVNRGFGYLQDVACGGNIKQFLLVITSLLAAAMIGCWCDFLTVLYIGFVAAHTLPVLYERYEDQVDSFVYRVLDQFQQHKQKLNSGILRKIPSGKLKGKKLE
ncbi:hypothetical protein U1Q18_016601 [Sarracenia purpurea var. burkii]